MLTDSTETESEDDDEKTDLHAQRQKEEAAAKKAQIEGAAIGAGASGINPNSAESITPTNTVEVGDACAQNIQGLAEVVPVETSSGDPIANQTNQDNIVGKLGLIISNLSNLIFILLEVSGWVRKPRYGYQIRMR